MLSLDKNHVTDLSPLEPLTDLQFLILTNNKIVDLTPLHRMMKKDLSGGKEWAPYCDVRLSGNPLAPPSTKLLDELTQLGARVHK
jgi:Leucine-rich repeat (LRR) protein